MIGNGMDVLWRIFAALSFDCFKSSPSKRSSTKLGSSHPASMESSSLTGSISLSSDLPHCQCCISYEARLKRLSCGHLYCSPCSDHIVNLAFEDIEGLSEYPCPICKSLRHLGGLVHSQSYISATHCSPFDAHKHQVADEKMIQWD
ncbi:hypothetical protein AALO_G00182800 [Alosa alosa]|uniref:RING-type domain-containing protein n=1 Tax=Alosa alosa TaxID=278164 RepID=A0AAV6GCU7_9TELE|nr:hypothetical protein AALO_G00182800 [Alosa alosa]